MSARVCEREDASVKMTTMSTRRFSLLAVLAPLLVAVGCGSSVEPQPHAHPAPAPAAVENDAGVAPRSLKTGSLLPYSPQNLLLDVTFREGGWGHFNSFYDGNFNPLTTPSRIFSDSPGGVGAPVGVFKDSSATDEKSKALVSLASFLGGKGPFVAHVWVSRSNVAGAPVELPNDPLYFRAAVAGDVGSTAKGWDLQQKTTRVHGARTWVLYEAKIIDNLPSGFFVIRFGRLGGQYMVTAPEVVPLSLLPAGDAKMSGELPAVARPALPEEIAAAAAYARQPIQLGLPKVPRVVPGKHVDGLQPLVP